MAFKRKFYDYEYWPFWLFYAPFLPYWIWNSIRSGSFSYFCKVNPGLEFGGFLDYSKYKILQQIPDEFKPKTNFIRTKNDILKILPKRELEGSFPFVVKPDFGERGKNVEVIRSIEDWDKYPLEQNLIVQEFVEFPFEFGIFYANLPENKHRILSITGKEFLVYRADGNSTLKEFVENHPRAVSRTAYLKNKFHEQWNSVLPKNTEILLEPIGNHNRGTRFFDASHLISDELETRINEIADEIQGFNYGRFDVKTQSEEDVKTGKFIILEINGANSEPTHIYDSEFTLIRAYKEVKRHLDVQFEISNSQPKTHSDFEFFKAVLKRMF